MPKTPDLEHETLGAVATRRGLLAGLGAFGIGALLPWSRALAQTQEAPAPFVIPREYLPTRVRINEGWDSGTIHIFTNFYFLYWIDPEQPGTAIRYAVGVGEEGRQLRGSATIQRKEEWPRWTPTANMIRRRPDLYKQFAGGMEGGPGNPLGARALYLYRGGRDTMYRIHGTHAPHTIGSSISNGCIRLINEHVEDLYERVPLGTRVYVHNDPRPESTETS